MGQGEGQWEMSDACNKHVVGHEIFGAFIFYIQIFNFIAWTNKRVKGEHILYYRANKTSSDNIL